MSLNKFISPTDKKQWMNVNCNTIVCDSLQTKDFNPQTHTLVLASQQRLVDHDADGITTIYGNSPTPLGNDQPIIESFKTGSGKDGQMLFVMAGDAQTTTIEHNSPSAGISITTNTGSNIEIDKDSMGIIWKHQKDYSHTVSDEIWYASKIAFAV